MSCNRNGAPGRCDQPADARPASGGRLLPKVTFGLSAAILAGVVVVAVTPAAPAGAAAPESVMATAGLSGAFGGPGGFSTTLPMQTACCA